MRRIPETEWMDLPDEADAYAVADFSDVNQAFADRLIELADGLRSPAAAFPRLRAVDLGCGPADIPARLRVARPEWLIVGVDASRPMLDLAKRQFPLPASTESTSSAANTLLFTQADSKALPFASGAFDVVFSNSILHHITDTDRFWREARRVAAPDALFFVRDLARPESESAARAIVEQYAGDESPLLQEEFHRSLLSAYTPDEVRGQLARAGLEGLRVTMASDRHLDIVSPCPAPGVAAPATFA